jgi:hypothetical protein
MCNDERSRADMAAIKAREAAVRDAIRRREPEVDTGPFQPRQLGLFPVVADRRGGIWMVLDQRLELLAEVSVEKEE